MMCYYMLHPDITKYGYIPLPYPILYACLIYCEHGVVVVGDAVLQIPLHVYLTLV